MSFGTDLQREREAHEVSLEMMAEDTRVSLRFLRALEEDDFRELPGGLFNKNIVRNYCRYLGVEAAPWVERFDQEAPTPEEMQWSEFAQAVKRNRTATPPSMRRRWWLVLLMAVGLAGIAWAAWRLELRDRVGRLHTPEEGERRRPALALPAWDAQLEPPFAPLAAVRVVQGALPCVE